MIEIIWTDNKTIDYEAMLTASSLMAWLLATISQNEEYHTIDMNGYMLVNEKAISSSSTGCSILILSGDIGSQTRILKILQQPPNEYKGKYIARIPYDEPDPVKELPEVDTESSTTTTKDQNIDYEQEKIDIS